MRRFVLFAAFLLFFLATAVSGLTYDYYLSFDDSTLTDNSGSGNDATLKDGTYVTAYDGIGFQLDGDNDGFYAPSSIDCSDTEEVVTMGGWFYIDSAAVDYELFFDRNNGADFEVKYDVNEGNIDTKFAIDETGGNDYCVNLLNGLVPLDEWFHLTIKRNTTGTYAYLNGTLTSSCTDDLGPLTAWSANPIYSGLDRYNGDDYIGKMDEVFFACQDFSDAEIQSIADGNEKPSGGGGDTTPPVITITYPENNTNLSYTTTSVTLQLTTDEDANCTYSTSGYVGTLMSTTDGTSHSQTVSVSAGNTYTYYYNCSDSAGNEAYAEHTFAVNETPVGECSYNGSVDSADFYYVNGIDFSCSTLRSQTAQGGGNFPVLESPPPNAIFYKRYNYSGLDADVAVSASPTSYVNVENTTIDGVQMLRTGQVCYSSDNLPSEDNFSLEIGTYINTTANFNIMASSLWIEFKNSYSNGNGFDAYFNKYPQLHHFAQNNVSTGYHDFKFVQLAYDSYYEQIVYIDGVEVHRSQERNHQTSPANDLCIGTDGYDMAVAYVLVTENTTLSQYNNTNGTSTDTYVDTVYYRRAVSQLYSKDVNDTVVNVSWDRIDSSTSLKDDVILFIQGCDSSGNNCTKEIPYPIAILEQDGFGGTSNYSFNDYGKQYTDLYDFGVVLSAYSSSLDSSKVSELNASPYAFGVEGNSEAAQSYLDELISLGVENRSFWRAYQDTNTPEPTLYAKKNFRWLATNDYNSHITTLSEVWLYANQFGTGSIINYDTFVSDIDDLVSDGGLGVFSFHTIDADSEANFSNAVEYAYNQTLTSDLRVWTYPTLEDNLFFTHNVTDVSLDYVQGYDYYRYVVLVKGDAEVDNIAVSFGASAPTCTPDWQNTTWTDWYDVSIGDCVSNIQEINQSRNLTEYDANECPDSVNTTYVENRSINSSCGSCFGGVEEVQINYTPDHNVGEWNSQTNRKMMSQVFTVVNGSFYLSSFAFRIAKLSGAVGSITAELWNVSGGVPDVQIADFGVVDLSNVSTDYELVSFDATDSPPYLENGTQYALVVTGNTTDQLFVVSGNSSESYDGGDAYGSELSPVAWTSVGYDFAFVVWSGGESDIFINESSTPEGDYFSTSSVTFTINVTTQNTLTAMLYIDDVNVQNKTYAAGNNLVSMDETVSEGDHSYYFILSTVCDNVTTTTKQFTVDLTSPVISTNLNNTVQSVNITFQVNVSDDNFANFSYVDSCNNSGVVTSTSTYETVLDISSCELGNHTTNVTACDLAGNCVTETYYWESRATLRVIVNSLSGQNISSLAVYVNGSLYANVSANYYDITNLTFGDYNITVDPEAHQIGEAVVEVNETYQEYTFDLYTMNSVNINIYSEENMSLLEQNVTVIVIGNLTSFTNHTSTGQLYIDFLVPSDYELRFESAGFNPRSAFITVTPRSSQNITIYMTANATTELQVIEVYDTSNEAVEGAIVWLQKEEIGYNDTWVTVQEAQTNSEGKTSVWVERDVTVYYRFAVIYDGIARPIEPSGEYFTTKTTFIPNIQETIRLIVNLQEADEDSITDTFGVVTNVTIDNDTATFRFIDGGNTIVGGRLTVSGRFLNNKSFMEVLSSEEEIGSSGVINYTFPITNNTMYEVTAELLYSDGSVVVSQQVVRFDADTLVDKNLGLLYAATVVAVVALVTLGFGTLWGSITTIATLFPLKLFGLIDIPTTVITSLIALAIILFLKTKKNQNA